MVERTQSSEKHWKREWRCVTTLPSQVAATLTGPGDSTRCESGTRNATPWRTLEELHERLSAAFAAKTYGQLTHILADLPGQGRLAELAATSHPARPRSWDEREEPTATDRAGRFAALALLMLAMMIWLFTALIFASHGMPHPAGGPYP